MARQLNVQFLANCDRKAVDLEIVHHADGLYIGARAVELFHQPFGHRRPYRVVIAAKQHRLGQFLDHLAAVMQNADQGEQAAGRVGVDLGLAFKPLLQHPRAFVVNPASRHIDGLDLSWR